ncbi:MAG TPA: DUF3473 domain-containing protein [Longimicrobium sp.]|jgi:polysaccharide deacetylase family protein (PEP-CTERM system associated)|uniref:DUF3473 domain-containing protein n=1 Tax=Longimicrobium sp. TaxID=2029185 RepID=UPI002ED84D09
MTAAPVRHAFTVDVEDWYQAIPIAPGAKAAAEKRLPHAMDVLLELLDRRGVRGTFYWLGPAAEEHPEVLRRTVRAGHEIGCHGWSHDLVYEMTPERFRDETRRACDAISKVTGAPVAAYRAAYFSVTRRSLWALDVLAELGFSNDSSIFPVVNWRYGIPDYGQEPRDVATPSGIIREYPLSVRQVMGRAIPVSGGAYLRIYPYALTRANFRAAERDGRPVIFYIHPWELDPGHPRIRFHWKPRLTHYARIGTTVPKLERLLGDFSFTTLKEVMDGGEARYRSAAL